MFTEKQWSDCNARQKANYLRVITGVWSESAKDRAEKFLDSHNPAMAMSGEVIIAPSATDVERAAFVDLLAGKVVQS